MQPAFFACVAVLLRILAIATDRPTDRPGHDRLYAIDASKLETELGWTPAETFETGIRKIVQWYLDHPEWVSNVSYRDWVAQQYGN